MIPEMPSFVFFQSPRVFFTGTPCRRIYRSKEDPLQCNKITSNSNGFRLIDRRSYSFFYQNHWTPCRKIHRFKQDAVMYSQCKKYILTCAHLLRIRTKYAQVIRIPEIPSFVQFSLFESLRVFYTGTPCKRIQSFGWDAIMMCNDITCDSAKNVNFHNTCLFEGEHY